MLSHYRLELNHRTMFFVSSSNWATSNKVLKFSKASSDTNSIKLRGVGARGTSCFSLICKRSKVNLKRLPARVSSRTSDCLHASNHAQRLILEATSAS